MVKVAFKIADKSLSSVSTKLRLFGWKEDPASRGEDKIGAGLFKSIFPNDFGIKFETVIPIDYDPHKNAPRRCD